MVLPVASDNTYIVFGSDNGYHLGEHALYSGKTTAYDHDIRTPLVVRPPGGLAAGAQAAGFVQNVDVAPTFLALAGAEIPEKMDGVPLTPLLTQPDLPWRTTVLMELTNNRRDKYFNPDIQGHEGTHTAPTYNAIRTADFLYIDYSRLDEDPPGPMHAEYYDLTSDPAQVINLFRTLTPDRIAELNAQIVALTACTGAECARLQGLS